MKTENAVWKKIGGWIASGALVMALTAWGHSYLMADEYARLKETVKGHGARIEDMSKDINDTKAALQQLLANSKVTTVQMDHLGESLKELKELVKERKVGGSKRQ